VDVVGQTVTVVDESKRASQLPYDVLVLAIGARSITWGVPGVEEVRTRPGGRGRHARPLRLA
jgi:NADH dehydrogenase FAD-containing subunit